MFCFIIVLQTAATTSQLCAQGKDVKNSWSGSLLREESPICSRVADRLQEATDGSSPHPEVNLHTQRTRDFKHSRVDRWSLLPYPTDENLKSMFGWHRPVRKTATKGRNYGPWGRKSFDQQETVTEYEPKVIDALSLSQALKYLGRRSKDATRRASDTTPPGVTYQWSRSNPTSHVLYLPS